MSDGCVTLYTGLTTKPCEYARNRGEGDCVDVGIARLLTVVDVVVAVDVTANAAAEDPVGAVGALVPINPLSTS